MSEVPLSSGQHLATYIDIQRLSDEFSADQKDFAKN